MNGDTPGDVSFGQDMTLWAAVLIGAGVYPLVLIALSVFLQRPAVWSAGGGWMAALGFVAVLPSLILRRGPPRRERPASVARRWMLTGLVLAEIPAAISIVSYLLGASLVAGLLLCALTFALVFAWRPSAPARD